MLDQPAVFLGGQGGLVGPARIAYRTIIAAGSICRNDVLEENRLLVPPSPKNSGLHNFNQAQYGDIHRIVFNNLFYIGNLYALHTWYRFVRKRHMSLDTYSRACWTGALNRLESGIAERIEQLRRLVDKLPRSLEIAASQDDFPPELRHQQELFLKQWPDLEEN